MIKVEVPAGASLDHLTIAGDGDIVEWADEKVTLNLGLYDKLDQSTVVKVDAGRQVTLNAKKATPEWWPKLTKGPKPCNVKVDWASWKDEDEDAEEETEKSSKQPGAGGMDDDFDFGSMSAGGQVDAEPPADDAEPPADDADAPAQDEMGDDNEARIEELPDAPGDA